MYFFPSDTVINNIMTQWQVQNTVEKRNTRNGSKAASFRNLENKIKSVLDHEEKIISKGHETQFIRNNDKSAEIGRKYRIMKALQTESTRLLGSKNASLVSRTQNSELCQNLTAEFSKPDCLPSNCRSSDPYRSIDGCCNNLENLSFGKLSFLANQSMCLCFFS